MNFYDLTLEEQIRCIESARKRVLEETLSKVYNSLQIRINRKEINAYYDNLIKNLMSDNITQGEVEKEELRKVA